MHRAIVAIAVACLVIALISVRSPHSSAQGVPTELPVCLATVGTGIKYIPCPTATTGPLPATTPVKDMSVSGPIAAGAGVVNYNVTITSQLACFPLPEPISLSTLGSPGSAVLVQLGPHTSVTRGDTIPSVAINQTPESEGAGTGSAVLEVLQKQLGPAGLVLKAEWPREGVTRLAVIATPSESPTPVPPTAVPSSTPTPSGTSTPAPTATSTPIPTSGPIPVQAAVSPPVVNGQSLGGDTPTLCALSLPGATCFPTIHYLPTDAQPTDAHYQGAHQSGALADASGLVEFPWTESSTGDFGVAAVDCTLGPNSGRGCAGFFILQNYDSGLSEADRAQLLSGIQTFATRSCSALR